MTEGDPAKSPEVPPGSASPPELAGEDLLSRFTSRVTPPFSVFLAADVPAPEPRVPIELESFLGKIFRGYQIVKVLGRGGFGAVFLAEHPTLRLKRALKFFLDVDRSGPGFEKFRERCLAESRLQASLKHENIVQVVDAFLDQGYVIQVMEYVDGPNLRTVIQGKNRSGEHFTPAEVLELLIPVARGLAHAHRAGIVHRDLKPENILLDRKEAGRPKITDFGTARDLEETGQRHTTAGYLVGTPIYMAPELIATRAPKYDQRVDVYPFGVIAYELSLGVPPFDHEERFRILEMHEKEAVEPLSLKRESFPEELDRIILTCLEKRPGDRFASADELLRALEACRTNLGRGITTVERQDWERKSARRRTRVVVSAVALALLVAALPWLGLLKSRPAPDGTTATRPARDQDAAAPGIPRAALDPTARKGPSPTPEGPAAPEALKAASPKEVSSAKEFKAPEPEARKAEAREPAPPLRVQLAAYPLSAEESGTVLKLLDLFTRHREEILGRTFEPLEKDLEELAREEKTEYTRRQGDAARELVRLAADLARARQKQLSEPKSVSSPGESLRGPLLPAAETAALALSGEAVKALDQMRTLAETREKSLLWLPVVTRLLLLEVQEAAKSLAAKAEDLLARENSLKDAVEASPEASAFRSRAQALRAAEPEVTTLFPYLAGEFEAASREEEAMGLLLERAYSRVAANYPLTEACPAAATLMLARFMASLEEAHDDLIAKAGWINYFWELRPDPPTREERLQYWDVLDGGGCVLRDPAGPRSLIMGRSHPRPAEGILIRFDFEPLGEEGTLAEWRLHLRREGGRNSTLRFGRDSISLWPFTLGTAAPEKPLGAAKLPRPASESTTHTCALVPGEGLHVFLDGTLVATFAKEDALIPSQLSLVVLHGKLSVRSIQVKKKPSPSDK